eukprot:jgi/Botrbrau1/7257/Bobra.0021s0038.2
MDDGLRKPLYDGEKHAAPATVCVTGGTGYIAGAIIKRLLAMGMTVHATVRDPDNQSKLAHLQRFPGAAARLKYFKATLEDPASFDHAMEGCTYLIHTASPVIMTPPRGQEREKLINPAIGGVENALNAATRSGTVKRVVLTSSVAAVVGDNWERGEGHVFTEADWNISATDTYLPYHRSKVLAEKKAFELEGQQRQWSLVTIQPPIVQGPPPGNVKCEVVGFMRKILNGGYYPWAPASCSGYVDIDDVAAAHTLGMVMPKASGRYIVCSESLSFLQYVNLLRPQYSMYKLPWIQLPWIAVWFAVQIMGFKLFDFDLLKCTFGAPFDFLFLHQL